VILVCLCALTACGYDQPPASSAFEAGGSADHIVIEKAAHRMTLYDGERVLRSYRVSLGGGGLAPKSRKGDRRTPEGKYRISGRNARSAYHLSLRISYPTPAQMGDARRRGVSPGGDIMIHGLPNGRGWMKSAYVGRDWTDGCIAVTDHEIEEIWRLVEDGAAIRIVA